MWLFHKFYIVLSRRKRNKKGYLNINTINLLENQKIGIDLSALNLYNKLITCDLAPDKKDKRLDKQLVLDR